jgi:hypothetical protein
MRPHEAAQCLFQLGAFLAQLAIGQLGQSHDILFALDQCRQHLAGRQAHDVGGDARQLDIGALQHLLQPIDQTGAFAHKVGTVTGQVAQVALRPWRDETGPHQSMTEQLGDPLRVLDIGLAARDRLDVLGIEQPDLEAPLQNVVHRLPILAGALHADVRAAARGQPVGEPQEFVRGGPKGLRLAVALTVGTHHETAHHHRLLVHINSRAARKHDVHPRRSSPGSGAKRIASRVAQWG